MGRDRSLDDQLAEVREVLAEARGVTKDLHHAVDRAREAFKGLAEEHMAPVVDEEMARMRATFEDAIISTREEILRAFTKMTNRLLTGKTNGNHSMNGVNLGLLLNEVRAMEEDP